MNKPGLLEHGHASRAACKPAHMLPKHWGYVLLLMLAAALGLVAKPAHAMGCSYQAPTVGPSSYRSSMQGAITVGRDVPVGTKIYQANLTAGGPTINILCNAGSYFTEAKYSTLPYGASGLVDPQLGTVYNTSVPGIGAVIGMAWSTPALPADALPVSYTKPTGLGFDNSWGAGWNSFVLYLVKTSNNVGAGTVRASDIPTIELDEVTSNNTSDRLLLLTGQLFGSVQIVTGTCTTPDVPVDLGTHYTGELTGVGTTTSSWVNVPIQLNNCPAFFGQYNTTTTDGNTGATSGTTLANAISYSVNPVTSVVNATQGVMALQPDGINPTATGIGIQLANVSGAALTYGSSANSNLSLNQTSGSSYTIMLKARYYQTAASTAAGQANGAATVTLIYN